MSIRGLLILVSVGGLGWAQPPGANYDEAKVPSYMLPDVLGKAHDAKSWEARRQEILEMYRKDVFGRAPGKPAKVSWESDGRKAALNGKATRELVTISFGGGPKLHMLVYVPAKATRPSPVF